MIIGERLRTLREQLKLSQGDIEDRTGLLRCYVSRVEHGHTVPGIDTLAKFAHALKVPMYQLLYDGEDPPVPLKNGSRNGDWGTSGRSALYLAKLSHALGRMHPEDRLLLLSMSRRMATRNRRILRKRQSSQKDS
jgi:transcriptional regulator with XRE-family HTH domain